MMRKLFLCAALILPAMGPLAQDQSTSVSEETQALEAELGYRLSATAKRRVTRQRARIKEGFKATGDIERCVNLRRVRRSSSISDTEIWFEATGRKAYINNTRSKCVRLVLHNRFTYRTPQNRICEGDMLTVLDPAAMPIGSCALGKFDVYKPVEKAASR